VLVLVLGMALHLGAGCRRQARSAEQALARLQNVVANRDPAALFDVLDQRSRWAWMTIQKSHREAYDIILSNYPEGPERERELRRFQKGAVLGSARALFADELGQGALAQLASPLPPVQRFETVAAAPAAAAPATGPDPESAEELVREAILTDGTRLPFRRGPDGSWGYSGLARTSAERQNRALHDVELVRASAADYERAAARSGR
jgi:hypothetical protein